MGIIKLQNANLHYSALAYRETSLKSYILKAIRPRPRITIEDIHALKNVSLTIHDGERVGLLGHNGAGKSTLLKAIAGIYPLSSGTRTVIGDIRAIFELALGFEMEATGVENIMYRGLLLGKSPTEMRALQNEIIDFAELGEFIHYPIKTYSSGMLVRLAFSITTAISGDILLIDESIGAGDWKFQEKAKARIRNLIEKSQLLVLASHSDATLKLLCERGLVLQRGEIVFDGRIDDAVKYYHDRASER